MFITFEGIEGCGKSTQAKLLFEKLQKENIPVIFTYEPGDTPVGKRLREILLSNNMDPLTELLLFLADRREHISSIIKPALLKQRVVISDRYIFSTLAYQVYGRGLKRHFVDVIHEEIVENIWPERVYVLDLDVEKAFERKKHHTFDRIEEESKDFHKRVRDGFLSLAQSHQGCRILDASLPIEVLHKTIWEDIQTLLPYKEKN